ncbi:MAG TPA: hypothetical protein VK963_00080 [Candidatus Saccharimonadales bacterium]|nr:hypothetical protein [Candidatus Saccharimonadales bacterium]
MKPVLLLTGSIPSEPMPANNQSDRVRRVQQFLVYGLPLYLGAVHIYLLFSDSSMQTGRALRLTIIIPEIIIWVIASASAFRFKKYACSIADHPDGRALNHIANALLLLVIYIILLTTAGSIARLFADTDYRNVVTTLRNHVPLAVILASVTELAIGSSQLNALAGNNWWTPKRRRWLALSAILFFALFAALFYQSRPDLLTSRGMPKFALPPSVLLFTYILPHVVVWVLGFSACISLANYGRKAPGVLYRSLFKDLGRGTLITFICIFLAQFLIITTVSVDRRGVSLVLVYLVLILSTVGFLAIWRGAKKLDKLESVKAPS